MNNIGISFILPIYNVEVYLSEAIDSILKQNISKEIILVDDGSTDSSLIIALRYAKKYPFISVIHSQNQGVSAARNAGVKLSKGEYIMFIDPDDTLADGLDLKYIYQILIDNNCLIGKGLFDITFQNKRKFLFNPINNEVMDNNIVVTPRATEFALKSLPDNWFIHIGSYLIKKELLEQYKIQFNESLKRSEDIIFSLDLLATDEKIIEFPFLFYNYYKRDNSLTDKAIYEEFLESRGIVLNYLNDYHFDNDNLNIYVNKLYDIQLEYYMKNLGELQK